MSAAIETIITCDGGHFNCFGNDWSADQCHDTAKQQRATAKRDYGWHQVGRHDYCAPCWEYRKAERQRKAFEKEL